MKWQRHRSSRRLTPLGWSLGLALFVLLQGNLGHAQGATITLVESNYATPQTPQTTVKVPFTAAQNAGDLNVVVVGWFDSTSTITSVTDSRGNAYTLAVGPTRMSGTGSQSVYYAKNITAAAANANVVTVSFSTAVPYPDVRILEYNGLDPSNPLDVAAAATGTGSTSNSGAAITTNANDLLIGANNVTTATQGPGTGFTERVITVPNGGIVEDRVVTTTGSYSATALMSSGGWIMQMLAFRAAGSGGAASPSITSLNPNSGAVGTPVTITGANFGSTQGTSTITFNGATATPTNWSPTGIVAPVPSGATTGGVVVRVSGLASNAANFTVQAAAPITFVQSNYAVPQGPQAPVAIPYTAGQNAGDLNVVVVAWFDVTSTVSSVVDSKGNAYTLAVGPSRMSGTGSQSIYYAKNVVAAAANGNVVTVTFSTAVPYPEVRILEYSGLDPTNPLDVVAAATGTGTTSNSGAAITTNANDLLIGANNVTTTTSGPGAGFTKRFITVPNGDIAEDRVVTTTGSYNATAFLSSGDWIMQMVAFRAAGGLLSQPISVALSGAPASLHVNTAASITATVSNDAQSKGVSWSVTCGSASCGSFSPASTASGVATSFTAPGSVPTGNSVTVNAISVADNSKSASATVTILSSAPPGITSANQATFNVGVAGAFTVTATGAPTPTLTMTGTLPSGVEFIDNGNGTATLSGTPAAGSSGTYSTTITAQNGVTPNAVQTFTLTVSQAASSLALPIKASTNGRYLVDQNNVPFLMLGDSPQSMMANLSTSTMATYMADRQAHGFNTILVDVLVDSYGKGNANGTTYDGIAPFTSGTSPTNYDLSTPNATYFARLDTLVNTAASYGLVVMLDPIETGGWLTTLENNGATKAYNYGAFLGNRYKNSPNIMWASGNDFQTWNSSVTDNNLVHQVMLGIASADPNHLQTIELNYNESYSNQDYATLGSTLTLDAAYTYTETYDEVLQAYNSSPTLPVFMVESNYEYENDTGFFSGVTGTFILREQEYWTMTSGASGQLYGNKYIWPFASGWQSFLDSPGTLELAYVNKLFKSIPWWDLVPDQGQQIVTSGYGIYNGNNGNLPLANYVTTAWVPDGSLAVIYDPAGNALTVNLARFNQAVTAAWYDPSNGTFTTIAGSPFTNSGTHQFTPLGTNNDGDHDWVLVLEVNPNFL